MGSRDECEAVGVIERLGNVVTECVAGAARRNAPAVAIVRVGPEQVAHGTFVWDFLETVESANVVESVDGRRETSVKTKYLKLKTIN